MEKYEGSEAQSVQKSPQNDQSALEKSMERNSESDDMEEQVEPKLVYELKVVNLVHSCDS